MTNKPFLSIPKLSKDGLALKSEIVALAVSVERALQRLRLVKTDGLLPFEAPAGQGQGYNVAPAGSSANGKAVNVVISNPFNDTLPIITDDGGFTDPDGTDYETPTAENDPLTDPDAIAGNTISQSETNGTILYNDTQDIMSVVYGNTAAPETILDGSYVCPAAPSGWVWYYPATGAGTVMKLNGAFDNPHAEPLTCFRLSWDRYITTTAVVAENTAPTAEPNGIIHLNVPGMGVYKGKVVTANSVRSATVPPHNLNTYVIKRWAGRAIKPGPYEASPGVTYPVPAMSIYGVGSYPEGGFAPGFGPRFQP